MNIYQVKYKVDNPAQPRVSPETYEAKVLSPTFKGALAKAASLKRMARKKFHRHTGYRTSRVEILGVSFEAELDA